MADDELQIGRVFEKTVDDVRSAQRRVKLAANVDIEMIFSSVEVKKGFLVFKKGERKQLEVKLATTVPPDWED